MIAAAVAVQRPADAKLLVVDAAGTIRTRSRLELVEQLRRGDLIIANDAATIPASLMGLHVPSNSRVEIRLAGSDSLSNHDVRRSKAVVFGRGDYRQRTEDRPAPPLLCRGDHLELGPLSARVLRVLGHPRLVDLQFAGSPAEVWEGIARHGRPIQYSHLPDPVALWDTWTTFAGPPVAFEAPSAGFVVDWEFLHALREQGIGFATITHAAGISSTGDANLDARLPFDEAYRIPAATALALQRAKAEGGRVIALGTTVVRALEHSASMHGSVQPGDGVATQRIGPASEIIVVDGLISGTHEEGTSHYELLKAFVDENALRSMSAQLNLFGYRTHEFGDSILVERSGKKKAQARAA